MKRTCLALLLLGLGLGSSEGPEEVRGSLDQWIAIASKLVPSSGSPGYTMPTKQLDAINAIGAVLTDTLEDEDKIVAALLALRSSPDGNVVNAALTALGRRNHRELLPRLFAEITEKSDQQSVYRVRTFALSLRGWPPPGEPSLELLRQGLESPNEHFRRVVAEMADEASATSLRPELEKLVVGDSKESVRIQAATTLRRLNSRESVPALRKALRGSESVRRYVGWALASLGSDPELDLLTPLLKSNSADTRQVIARGMGEIRLQAPERAIEALLPLLEDKSREVRLAAIKALGKRKEPRVVPAIRSLLKSKEAPRDGEIDSVIETLGEIGDDAAVAILNNLLSDYRVPKVLLKLTHPSTAYAAWDAYLCDPIRPNPDGDIANAGDLRALGLVEKLADEEIYRAIRLRAHAIPQGDWEKDVLDEMATRLAVRFPKAAAEPIETLHSKAPSEPLDRDKDRVPDRKDKYPDDDRRSEDIPVANQRAPVQFRTQFYAYLSLADEGPASRDVLFMAIDDDGRAGWVTKVNDLDPADYHVASSVALDREEWPLSNPGETPGVYRLDPSGVNSQGTVVGTASRKKVPIPLRQDVRKAHTTWQSGFIFERGQIRFDPPPPFAGAPLNVSYFRINNHGLIFGHREVREREGGNDVFRTFAFLGDHLFREVPAFDATALTDTGQMLCFRAEGDKSQSFIWDGTAFRDLGSLGGRPASVRALAMNQKLQVVGLSDTLDKEGCPVGFFWENGQMRAFSELIPDEFRPHLRSAIPYLISDDSITFRAEERAGPFPQLWPKKDFNLRLGADGVNDLRMQVVSRPNREDE